MAWRVAKSLEVLAAEIHAISPETTIYFIGDAAHQARPSDHNPNPAGVVCAEDIMEGHTDLAALAEQIRTSSHPNLAYLIYNRRIANRKTGFRWSPYAGIDPHTNHIHVSVGVGTDGNRVPPYDDTQPWGIATVEEDMGIYQVTFSNDGTIYGVPGVTVDNLPVLVPLTDLGRCNEWQAAGMRRIAAGVPLTPSRWHITAVNDWPDQLTSGGGLSPAELAEVEAAAQAGAEAGAPTHDELVAAAEEGANLAEDR